MSTPGGEPARRDPRDVEALWHILGFVGSYLLVRWLDEWEERRALNKAMPASEFRRLMEELKGDPGR